MLSTVPRFFLNQLVQEIEFFLEMRTFPNSFSVGSDQQLDGFDSYIELRNHSTNHSSGRSESPPSGYSSNLSPKTNGNLKLISGSKMRWSSYLNFHLSGSSLLIDFIQFASG